MVEECLRWLGCFLSLNWLRFWVETGFVILLVKVSPQCIPELQSLSNSLYSRFFSNNVLLRALAEEKKIPKKREEV